MKKFIFLICVCFSYIFADNIVDIKQITLPFNCETENFNLYCIPEDKQEAQRVLDISEKNFKQCSIDFNHKYSAKINLYVFHCLQDLHIAIGEPNAGDNAINRYISKEHAFLTINPEYPGSFLATQEVLDFNIHGLVNLFINDKYKKEIPFWLIHGIGLCKAKYLDKKVLEKIIQNKQFILTLEQLENFDFRSKFTKSSTEDLDIYRACCYLVVEYLNQQWGWEKILALLEDYSSFEKILGVSKEKFKEQWVDYLCAKYLKLVELNKIEQQYPSFVDINSYGLCLRAAKDLVSGTVVATADFEKTDKVFIANSLNDEDKYVAVMDVTSEGEPVYGRIRGKWAFCNHSCDPNCTISDTWQIITNREVKQGEELTTAYDALVYNCKWQDSWSFVCKCGASCCKKIINGYRDDIIYPIN